MKKSKKTAIKFLIGLAVVLALLVGLVVFSIYAERIPDNPEGTVGNTAGNLNNSGYFCERNGRVFFANVYDGGALYAMNADETEIEKLANATVTNLLADDNYIYYYQNGASGDSGLGSIRVIRSFNRARHDGSDVTGLTRDAVTIGQLVGSDLYLQAVTDTGTSFYRIGIDKKDQEELAAFEVNPAAVSGSTIYYYGTVSDHNLYALNTVSGTTSLALNHSVWYPCVEGNYIYFMDVSYDYRLARVPIGSTEVEVLTDARIDCFNVGNGYIYYQTNGEDAALHCMYTDGTGDQIVAQGNFTAINMTSRYVYFQSFGNDSTWYHTPLGGSGYTTFDAARNAAVENLTK